MHNKIVKASSGSIIPTGFNPFGTSKSPLDDMNKMKLGAPGPSKEFTKAAQKNAKSAANVASTGNKMGMSGGLQAGLGAASSMLGGLSTSGLTQEQASTREGIRSAISSAGPIGAIIGAASGVVDAIGSATGLNLDNIDADAAKRAGIGGKAATQGFINSLPGVSMLVGMFGGRTAKSYKSAEIDQMTNAYGGSVADINAAQALSGKRMLGTGKVNKFIREQNRVNNLITDISLESKLRKSNSAGDTYLSQNQNKYAGYTPQLLLSKKGMKFPELDVARSIINSWTVRSTEEPQKFQLGGKMNLIPEGALHARKHNLEKVNPELEGQITSKGIPVVAQGEGGVIQQAEIEKEEVIFRKEFTDKLESLYKQYQEDSSDDIAIEAGKLICYELLKNTDDRSGLIKSIE
jgi:hypothetical protein|nr:MAG TPA: hypothetical protein [Crassvirales sp.]DAO83143.1 MAG TPA: hypothetical protein [Bacteriophage sp.]